MKKTIGILTILAIMTAMAGCGKGEVHEEVVVHELTEEEIAGAEVEAEEVMVEGTHFAKIEVEDYGVIELELYGGLAPITVENFVSLAEEGFYDGLTFHRIIEGFMIQGGDPLGNGTGGSNENIVGEFTSNGVDNQIGHSRGVISMARSIDPDSASSQFFIMHESAPHLDGEYAAFGMVTSGMEVVDAIVADTIVEDGNGTVNAVNQPIIKSITVEN